MSAAIVLLINAMMDRHDSVAGHALNVIATLELRLACIHWIGFGILQVSLQVLLRR